MEHKTQALIEKQMAYFPDEIANWHIMAQEKDIPIPLAERLCGHECTGQCRKANRRRIIEYPLPDSTRLGTTMPKH